MEADAASPGPSPRRLWGRHWRPSRSPPPSGGLPQHPVAAAPSRCCRQLAPSRCAHALDRWPSVPIRSTCRQTQILRHAELLRARASQGRAQEAPTFILLTWVPTPLTSSKRLRLTSKIRGKVYTGCRVMLLRSIPSPSVPTCCITPHPVHPLARSMPSFALGAPRLERRDGKPLCNAALLCGAGATMSLLTTSPQNAWRHGYSRWLRM